MAIGTNSVIHYTSKIETLYSILNDLGFRFKYCSEKVVTRGNKNFSFAIAMVSFCDIPLSEYKKHFLKNTKKSDENLGYYGDYGIGLSREWVEDNGLNPVLYIDQKSLLSTSIRKSAELIFKDNKESIDSDLYPFYSKNVKGKLERTGQKLIEGYRFYDEREWRYVPEKKEINNNPRVLDSEKYESDKQFYNNKIALPRLKFKIEDIVYIIVKEKSELEHVTSFLRDKFPKDYLKLMPAIITSKQIIEDF